MIKMLITAQPPRDTANQDTVTIRALSSITSQQAEIIVSAVHASGLAWVTQTMDDYDGYLSILVAPATYSDNQKSFWISGTNQHLELSMAQDDNLVGIATFNNAKAISSQLLNLITT